MIELKSSFNPQEFEVYGVDNPYLTSSESDGLNLIKERVNSQLDWLAQLLGWNGPDYWTNLATNISQKRSLLAGTFGVYNSFLYPKIKEIRNWDNTVIVEADDRIEVGQIFYLGDYSYELLSLTREGGTYVLGFGGLTEDFLTSFSSGLQFKVDVSSARPLPFSRPSPLDSADIVLNTEVDEAEGSLSFTHETGNNINLPLKHLGFFQGSRLYFNAPVYLSVTDRDGLQVSTSDPIYSFSDQVWYLELPQISSVLNTTLIYKNCQLPIKTEKWVFDGKWGDYDILNGFTGVWGNKGGKLPFHFMFDGLGMHGCDPEKAVSMDPLESKLPFNTLLDLIYYQQAQISQQAPPTQASRHQVWWDDSTGALSVFNGQSLNCGPWVEIDYPNPPKESVPVGYLFEDIASFRGFGGEFEKDSVIKVLDGAGLDKSDGIKGLTGTISSFCEVTLVLDGKSDIMVALSFEFEDVPSFEGNAECLPGKVPIKIKNSAGLTPNSNNYRVKNLNVTLTENYPILLSKDPALEVNEWFISPPSNLRYIGDTRLFDNGPLLNGQLFWDYSEPDTNVRSASIFYYNRWEEEGGEWVMKGDWVQLNQEGGSNLIEPEVKYGVIQVFCEGEKLEDGQPYSNGDFTLTYTASQGQFSFNYAPITFRGVLNRPVITISDSLTTVFKKDISDFVFSGSVFRLCPNPLDSNTPLRLWKSEPLMVADSQLNLSLNPGINALVADSNNGPSDLNWERYFIRLSPLYKRDGAKWQKVNLICQNFGLWGSPLSYESMVGPKQEKKVKVYEEHFLFNRGQESKGYLYSEPYLYSDVKHEKTTQDDYENSIVFPELDDLEGGFEGSRLESYDPLHCRQTSTDRENNSFGSWEGVYVRQSDCSPTQGEITKDLYSGAAQKVLSPLWDSSIYKMPSKSNEELSPARVDSNHFKVCYAFFSADLSSAEDPCFDLG